MLNMSTDQFLQRPLWPPICPAHLPKHLPAPPLPNIAGGYRFRDGFLQVTEDDIADDAESVGEVLDKALNKRGCCATYAPFIVLQAKGSYRILVRI